MGHIIKCPGYSQPHIYLRGLGAEVLIAIFQIIICIFPLQHFKNSAVAIGGRNHQISVIDSSIIQLDACHFIFCSQNPRDLGLIVDLSPKPHISLLNDP
ncbi:hypothetical protein D3C76_1667730 [compost metagenome]